MKKTDLSNTVIVDEYGIPLRRDLQTWELRDRRVVELFLVFDKQKNKYKYTTYGKVAKITGLSIQTVANIIKKHEQ